MIALVEYSTSTVGSPAIKRRQIKVREMKQNHAMKVETCLLAISLFNSCALHGPCVSDEPHPQ